jgi:hypothetical protein
MTKPVVSEAEREEARRRKLEKMAQQPGVTWIKGNSKSGKSVEEICSQIRDKKRFDISKILGR